MTPEHFLLLWENQYGTLKAQPDLREKFLLRSEVSKIITFPEELVKKSLLYSPKLKVILKELVNGKITPERPVPYGTLSRDIFVSGSTSTGTHRTWQEAQREMN